MNGIQSLMGQLMPGQAPMQPLPGVMPQPGAPTPGAMTSSLKNMSLDQLKALYQNPNPNSPPLWAVISALAEKQKEAQAMMAAQGQAAMAQNQQMQQQPPVAAQVVEAAEQMEEPVMAMHGGEMHGYAGGGAVAFQTGTSQYGLPFPAAARRIDVGGDVPIYAPGPDKAPGETEAEYLARKQREAAEADEVANRPLRRLYRYLAEKIREPSPVAQMRTPATRAAAASTAEQPTLTGILSDLGPPPGPMMPVPEIQIAPSPAPATGPRRQPAAVRKPTTPTDQGIGALAEQPPTPAIDARAAAAAAEQAAMLRRGEITPEMIAARGGIDKLLGASVSGFEEERKRREAAAQQRMQEAQARFERRGLEDMAGIGRLLSGMRGAKTLYEGLTGAGAAAGKYQEDKEAALRAAQEKFDLSNREVFELSRLQDQVRMKQAELAEARASGDAQRSVQAAIDVAQSQKQLAEYQTNLGIKREEMVFKSREVKAAEDRARADLIQAGRPTEFQQKMDLYRRDPATFEKLFGAREKNSYDVINDNAQRKFTDWSTSIKGMQAKPEERNAMWQEILDREIETAKRFGVKTPEGASSAGKKVMTMADVQATATARGKTVDEVRKAATAAGYTIQ